MSWLLPGVDVDAPELDVLGTGVLVRDPNTGEMFLMPYMSVQTFWVYNKTIFEEAGITVPAVPCSRIERLAVAGLESTDESEAMAQRPGAVQTGNSAQ